MVHLEFKCAAALLVHHFVARQRLIESQPLVDFLSMSNVTQYTLDPGLVNLYFYTLRETNNYIKRASPFYFFV